MRSLIFGLSHCLSEAELYRPVSKNNRRRIITSKCPILDRGHPLGTLGALGSISGERGDIASAVSSVGVNDVG